MDDDEGAGLSDASIQHTCAHGDMACDLLQSTRHWKLGVGNCPASAGEVLTLVLRTTVTRDKERERRAVCTMCGGAPLNNRLSTACHRKRRHVDGQALRCYAAPEAFTPISRLAHLTSIPNLHHFSAHLAPHKFHS